MVTLSGAAEVSPPAELYVRDGDVDFDRFVASEYRSVLAIALALCGDASGAQDVAQEAFLAVFRKLRKGGLENPAGYVRAAAANLARSAVRRRLAELRAFGRAGPPPQVAALPDDSDQFWRAVRSLPARQAVVAALFYADDLSVADVARCLEMAEGTVKVHLSRARAALAVRLGVNQEEEG